MSTGATVAPAGAPGRALPVVPTERPLFTTFRLDSIAAALRGSTIVDARNLLSPDDVRMAGLSDLGAGRR